MPLDVHQIGFLCGELFLVPPQLMILAYTRKAFAITTADPRGRGGSIGLPEEEDNGFDASEIDSFQSLTVNPRQLRGWKSFVTVKVFCLFFVLQRARTVRDGFVVFFFRMLAVRLSIGRFVRCYCWCWPQETLVRCMLFVGCRSSHGRTIIRQLKQRTNGITNLTDDQAPSSAAGSFVPTNQ